MPRRSKVTRLPAQLKEWLDAELVRRGFADYVQLAKDLKRESVERGKPVDVSRAALQRYGKNWQNKLEAIKVTTEAMRAVAQAMPDDPDLRSSAIVSVIQTQVFDNIVQLQEAVSEEDKEKRTKLLSQVARNMATLTRASLHQKKHELEIRSKLEAAAEKVASRLTKGGTSKKTVDEIRRDILGIVN